MPAASEKPAETSGEAPATPVTLTVRAAEKVKEIRVEEKIQDGYALRLKVLGGGCSGFAYDLYFDQP
jgi:Fe-S cluster assembly iron-binding protein IscA